MLIYRAGARDLLLRWPELREVIPDAFEMLKDSFGASAQIVLDRFDDPEAEEEASILYLVVRTELEAHAAREAMDRLDEWWLMNEERANGHLQISLEFAANADLNPEVTVDAVGAATVMRLLDESPGPNEAMLRLFSDNDPQANES
jgi:hypothetical protein